MATSTRRASKAILLLSVACNISGSVGFAPSTCSTIRNFGASRTLGLFQTSSFPQSLRMVGDESDLDVIELVDESASDKIKKNVEQAAAGETSEGMTTPFLSQQNELADGVLNPDMSDAKQARVIIYLIISLLPVILLIPLMLGSRDFIPPDALPPVSI